MPTKDYIKTFNLGSSVRDIISNNRTRNYFTEFFPEIYGNDLIFERIVDKNLDELPDDYLLSEIVTTEKLAEFIKKVSE